MPNKNPPFDKSVLTDCECPASLTHDIRRYSYIEREARRRKQVAEEAKRDMRQIKTDRIRNGDDIMVSEHAVLRYLERAKGIDVDAIRKHIIGLYLEAEEEYPNEFVTDDCVLLRSQDNENVITTVITKEMFDAAERQISRDGWKRAKVTKLKGHMFKMCETDETMLECNHCHMMMPYTFARKEVLDYLNEHAPGRCVDEPM
jgi:hypothetical protein